MSEQVTKSSRWKQVLLVVSLGLNLAVVGLVVGMALSGGPGNGPARYDLTVGPLTRAMEGERRDAVREALRNSGVFRPADRTNMRQDVRALLENLRADTFDQTAFRDALGRQRMRLQAGQEAVLDAVTAQIEDMSQDERAAFADRLEQQLRRDGPRRNN